MYIETCVYTTLTCRIPRIAAPPEFDGLGGGGIGIKRPFSEKLLAGERAKSSSLSLLLLLLFILFTAN